MSILLKKGNTYNADYSSADFPSLSSDWIGDVSLYAAYPGVATFTKALTRSADKMHLELTVAEILNLNNGAYYFVTTISNPVLGVSVTTLDYATVAAAAVFSGPMTKLYATIAKADGTPAGKQAQTMANTTSGVAIILGWKGIDITISNNIADVVAGSIIDTETITIETNAAGYAETYVTKGLSYTATCPYFGKTLTVDTTGLDEINLSTFF